MCLDVFLLGFILYGTLCTSWTWVTISFSMLGKFSTIISSSIFLRHFLFLFFICDPYNLNVGALNVVPEVSETVLISFHLFSLFCSTTVISTILSSSLLICSSASVILLLIPSSVFFISVIVLFITLCLFFSSSRSYVNLSFIFSICASILFPRSCIIFTMNYFSGTLPISSSFGLVGFYLATLSSTYFSVISFCLTYCVCCLLSAGCRVVVPLASDVCPLVGEVCPGACARFLLGGTGACPLVGRAGSCPSGGQGHVKECVFGCLWA